MRTQSNSYDDWGYTEDEKIVAEAQKRFDLVDSYESQAWANFDYDYKFVNGDSVNNYQWDNWVVGDRLDNNRPCLTVNKTMQHCLMIINDGKQNKPGINIRPVGDDASFEVAQVYEEIIRHIEYMSNAENVYDTAAEFQVYGGIGYWRLITDWVDPEKGWDQDIFIRPIKNPKSVRLDKNINEKDGSDARWGIIFSDMDKDIFEDEYPDFEDIGGQGVLGNTSNGWYTKDTIRVAEYFRKSNKKDRWIWFIAPDTGEEVEGHYSVIKKTKPEEIALYEALKHHEKGLPEEERTWREREVTRDQVEWYVIAGNTIIKKKKWAGKYIPIIRIVGIETVIDGQLDRKGHVRALLDPQRIYNINTSANVEFGALQTKSPIMASMDAIEGFENYYRDANVNNAAWLPFNAYDDEGRALPMPQRMAAPQPSPAYVQQLQIAQNEMMMVTGQYQAQMGEEENAKSGIAINQRQRMGDRATYHFIDGQQVGIRYTGKQLIDLIPKIYDTKRVMRIEAKDGTIINLTLDKNAEKAYEKTVPDPSAEAMSNVVNIAINPSVGQYAVVSDSGPSFATRRQEAFNALTQIAAQNKEFMNIGGDLLWRVADFPEAQELARRWRRIIPPNITGDAPNPQLTQAMEMASQKIEQQLAIIAKQTQELADKSRDYDLKEKELDLRTKEAVARENRADYDAENKRITALGNSGPAITPEQIQPVVQKLLKEMLLSGNLDELSIAEGFRDIENNPAKSPPPEAANGSTASSDATA